MTAAEVVSDPIGQINLILWATQPLPGEYSLRPVFREAGYRLLYIAPPMPLIPSLRDRLGQVGLSYRDAAQPDLLLERPGEGRYLVLECKRTMFGIASSAAEQARSLLLQTGEQFSTAVAMSAEGCHQTSVVYISKHCESPNPAEGLGAIRAELEGKGFITAPTGLLCLESRSDGIYLRDQYHPGVIPEELAAVVGQSVRVREVADGESPLPLMLIPWDPSVDQGSPVAQVGRQTLCHRVLSLLATRIGQAESQSEIEVVFDELLDEATFRFYERWRAMNRGVARVLRAFVGEGIHGALGDLGGIEIAILRGPTPGGAFAYLTLPPRKPLSLP